jgi:hypothetical protein
LINQYLRKRKALSSLGFFSYVLSGQFWMVLSCQIFCLDPGYGDCKKAYYFGMTNFKVGKKAIVFNLVFYSLRKSLPVFLDMRHDFMKKLFAFISGGFKGWENIVLKL